MSASEPAAAASVVDAFVLRAFVEACHVLEDGVAGVREIDAAMATGAGMTPGPFARADARGLDRLLSDLERADADGQGDGAFAPPLTLRRLVAQGRLGVVTGQGFYAYPRPDPGWADAPVQLETREDLALLWLANPPANAISPEVVEGLERAWEAVEGNAAIRVLVVASANPGLFSAGADLKAFQAMDAQAAGALAQRVHALLRAWERSRVVTVAAVNGLAYGGGCELALACDIRLAADSASFAQPEIDLGILPGFGGTQRLPRVVGPAKALEMNLTGEPISAEEAYENGLVNRVLADHELFDAALAWARKLASRPPLSVEHVKRVSHRVDLDLGLAEEREAFAVVFASEDAHEGIEAFLARRRPVFRGR